MKILVVIPTGQVFGLAHATLRFFKHLNPERFSVRFLVTHWNDGNFIERLNSLGIRFDLSYLGFLSKQPTWSNIRMTAECLLRLPWLFWDLQRLRRQHRFDLFYVSGYHLLIQMFPILLWSRIPVVCHVHEYYPDTCFYRVLFRLLDRAVTRYVVVSDAVRSRLQALGIASAKIEKIYNGVEAAAFELNTSAKDIFRKRYGWAESTPLVAFVGRVDEPKGIHDFVEAARIVCAQRSDVRMLLIGRAEESFREEIDRRVREYGLDKVVVICGPERNSPDLFRSIDILVAPSRCEESFGLVVAEAMAAAKPVVVTRAGGLPELIQDGETGFVVEKYDVPKMAEAILALVDDRAMAVEMGRKGRARVEKLFDIAKQTQVLAGCLADMVAMNR
ncbi:MAG: glycosyltransferase family 4 protein [Candidatus Tectomicrobia bacterium]|uniref:Glycosyltransferase family 4 protein n=1 Tax=Tectimicrobiota bacterium TaxID=2528274 RepID=A0A932GQT3_UNCTE|nr:glycosyltransferase family 4 protein [Candidatus Tectomicrobia bacterium]